MRKTCIFGMVLVILLVVLVIVYRLQRQVDLKSKTDLDRPLIVGVTSWVGYAGGILANRGLAENPNSIYFAKYGQPVRFVLLEDVDVLNKAFIKGGPEGVDVLWSTVDFWAIEQASFNKEGIDARVFIQPDWSRGGDAMVVENKIKTIEDLRGQKIALVQYTPSHWLLENALRDSKLTFAEQESIRKNLIFTQDAPSARATLVAGQVAAAIIWEPDVSQALKQNNLRVLVSTRDYPQLIGDVLIAKKDFITAHPKALEAFARGWFDGTAEASVSPRRAAEVLAASEPLFGDLGVEATEKSLAWAHRANLDDNKIFFGLNGQLPIYDQLFNRASGVWKELGAIETTSSAADSKSDEIIKMISR